MSNEGFRGVPGVPDGWELVRVDKPKIGEWFIDGLDDPREAKDYSHCYGCAIIRKIEQPAKYRPFANGAEADRFWNAALRFRNPHSGHEKSRFRVNTIGSDGVVIGLKFYSFGAAFVKFCVDDDGTPFGVRVDD